MNVSEGHVVQCRVSEGDGRDTVIARDMSLSFAASGSRPANHQMGDQQIHRAVIEAFTQMSDELRRAIRVGEAMLGSAVSHQLVSANDLLLRQEGKESDPHSLAARGLQSDDTPIFRALEKSSGVHPTSTIQQRLYGCKSARVVVVSCNQNDGRTAVGQIEEGAVDDLFGFWRGSRNIKEIAGDNNEVYLLAVGDVDDLPQHQPMLVGTTASTDCPPNMPISCVENLHPDPTWMLLPPLRRRSAVESVTFHRERDLLMITESYVPADTDSPVLATTVGSVLRHSASDTPDGLALVEGVADPQARRRWTFSELLSDSEEVARALVGRFDKGERVAVWAPNLPEWVLLEFGAGLAGVVLVTVNPAYQPQELAYVLRQSKASGIFYLPSSRGNPMEASLREVAPELPHLRESISFDEWSAFLDSGDPNAQLPEVSPDDPVQIQYTSGTTGFPKGALLHHRGITNNARFTAERLQLEKGGCYVNPMPLFHTGGCVLGVLGPAQLQAAHICLHQFDPGLILELCEVEKATHMLGVPTMLIAVMEHPDFGTRDLHRLTTVSSGGATVPAELVRRIEETLHVQFSIVYGQTEASPCITVMKPDDDPHDKATTLGPALPQTEIKVVDPETGATVPIGSSGELCTRGYLVMLGYFEMPEKTAETIDEDGWLHTGDLVTMDERGYTTITGRLKDMIIRGGENIYPREIEEVLFEHPKVADVAIVGLPDEKWGEIVGAFVRDASPDEPASDLELHDYLRERLAPQKTPRVWYHLDEFPLTPSGKVQKFVLRENWESGVYED